MSLLALFEEINGGGWTTSGLDVQYKVNKQGMLLFQCSNGASDWRYNFKASKTLYKGGDVEINAHEGFVEMWESIRHEIEKLSFESIGGYSQGGAFTTLAHENFFHRFGHEPNVSITFGCPPFIKDPPLELEMRFSRLVNWHNPSDLVYFAPQLIGYQHVGRCNVLRGSARHPKDCDIFRWLSGHSPEEYRQRLSCLA